MKTFKIQTIITIALVLIMSASCVITHKITFPQAETIDPVAAIAGEGTVIVKGQLILYREDPSAITAPGREYYDQGFTWDTTDVVIWPGNSITLEEDLEGSTWIITGTEDTVTVIQGTDIWADYQLDIDAPLPLKACKHENQTVFVIGNRRQAKCDRCGFTFVD